MYIKLTRFDNRSVWLNAAFVVTVEPRRDGKGTVVVPIGDGLDYDVRESPEEVLRMLEGCPAPQVVPVPVSDCLTKTPADVSPEPEVTRGNETQRSSDRVEAVSPVHNPPQDSQPPRDETPPPQDGALPQGEVASAASAMPAEKPAKKAARVKKPAAAKKAKPAKKPVLELSDDEVVRLGKLAPKSIAKLKNTLSTQFRVADVSATVAALEAKGVFKLDGNHVNWTAADS